MANANGLVCEVLPHEAALLRYLARVWPDASEIQGIRYDTYVRILEASNRLRITPERRGSHDVRAAGAG